MRSELTVSTGLPGRREVLFALGAVLISVLIFLVAVPFATRPLTQIDAFIPAYESALVFCDLVTAVLLFCQFNVLRSRAIFVLAGGYLFTAFVAIFHELSFPHVFSATGLLGAGPQTTIWLYTFWHGGFPLFVIAYALLKGEDRGTTLETSGPPRGGAGIAILAGVAVVIVLASVLAVVATMFESLLPVFVRNNRFTPAYTVVISSICILCLVAIVVLLRRGPLSMLDIWLMTVMCAWIFDISLCGVFNRGRYDLGWYAGRIYGLVAASSLLIVLLAEIALHYARLAQLSTELSAANKALEQLSLLDGLTSMANRRFFDQYLADQINVAHRHKRTLSLVLCDIDSFKSYNDDYGHQAGDECLKQVAAALQSCCRRPADMAARYGGEEFAMILPDTELIAAAQIAEAGRDAVARLRIPHTHAAAVPYVSISGGVAVMLPKREFTAAQLLRAADEVLYEAKALGRNQIASVRA